MLLAIALARSSTGASDVLPPDERTISALRAFEQRIARLYEKQLARARASGGPAAAASDEPTEPTEPTTPTEPAEEEKGPNDAGALRLRLRSVLDRMSVSTSWSVEENAWHAGLRLRYSRSVEYDPATRSFAVIEGMELAPGVGYRWISMGRSTRTIVRRTGFPEWDRALFAAPSGWLFGDRPDKPAEAEQLEPGTSITVSNTMTLFAGTDLAESIEGHFPVNLHAGPFASGEYFVRLERLAPSKDAADPREWMLSVGGQLPRGVETSLRVRTPELWLDKQLRLLKAEWKMQKGARFLLRAGPLDLRDDPEAELLDEAMAGAGFFRLADARLLFTDLALYGPRAQLRPELFQKLENFPNVERLLAIARRDPEGIPHTESISRFISRAHGEAGMDFWLALYGLELSSSWYAEESLMAPSEDASSLILTYPTQRRWDRGWLFFPSETLDLQMITVQDAEGPDLFTEVSLEVNDANAHRKEGRAYRAQMLRFLGPTLAAKFPPRTAEEAPSGPRELLDELPDLAVAPQENERVSIYLRIILGPRFHGRLLEGAEPGREQKKRITAWQKRISKTIRGGGDAIEELIRAEGTEDVFVSFRVSVTPHARRKEKPRPTTLYTGTFGDPIGIPGYVQLRAAFEAAGTLY